MEQRYRQLILALVFLNYLWQIFVETMCVKGRLWTWEEVGKVITLDVLNV